MALTSPGEAPGVRSSCDFGPSVPRTVQPNLEGCGSPATLEDLQHELRVFEEAFWLRLDRRLGATEYRLSEKIEGGLRAAEPLSPPAGLLAHARPSAFGGSQHTAGTMYTNGSMASSPQAQRSVQFQGASFGMDDFPAEVQVKQSISTMSHQHNLEDEDENRRKSATELDQGASDAVPEYSSLRALPCVHSIVKSPKFELFFGLCILLNGIYIGVQTNHSATHLHEPSPMAFWYVELLFTAVFTAELALRLLHEGPMLYCVQSQERHWAWLDTVIVLTSVGEAATEIVVNLSGGEPNAAGRSTSQFRIVRILRITRLVRIIRITRVIRFVRALRTMVHQLLSTMKSLFWAILLLVLIIYLFAIFFTQAVTGFEEEGDATGADTGAMRDYWATLLRSMLTLYMSITGGISWVEVIRPLGDVGPVYVAVFVGYIIMAQLAVLNVLTGVFCQNAIDSASHDADLVTQQMLQQREMYVKRLIKIFYEIDADDSGSITLKEFQDHLANPKVQAYFDSLELDTSDVWTLFKLLDADEGNRIDLDEFVSGAMRLRGAAKCLDLLKLTYEHKWMSKRMSAFMKKTEERLQHLSKSCSPVAIAAAIAALPPPGALPPGAAARMVAIPTTATNATVGTTGTAATGGTAAPGALQPT